MLGPYAITTDGRTVYGNVAVKEYHISRRDGVCYLLLVDEMAASRIDRSLADAITRFALLPGTLVSDRLMAALRTAALVAEEEPEPHAADNARAGAAADGEASDVGRNNAPAPVVNLTLFLAQTCNLACSYCYGTEGTYGGGGLMSAATARAAVDWLLVNSGDSEEIHLGFFGGEPLLNLPVLKDVVSYARHEATARGKQIGFGITTNGTLVSEDVARYLSEERIEPLISCDGPADVHDRQRPHADGRGSYADVVAAVQRLRPSFPGLLGRATICGDTDPFAVRRALDDAGFARASLMLASPVPLRDGDVRAEPTTYEVQRARMLAYVRKEVADLLAKVAAHSLDHEEPTDGILLLERLALNSKRHVGCGVGRGMRAVSVNGGIYPCHRFVGLEDTRMGDLGSYRAGDLNGYHRALADALPECRACWARYFCAGGCFYENRARTGDMHRPDPLFCRQTRAVIEDGIAGWCRLSDEDRGYVRTLLAKTSANRDEKAQPRP